MRVSIEAIDSKDKCTLTVRLWEARVSTENYGKSNTNRSGPRGSYGRTLRKHTSAIHGGLDYKRHHYSSANNDVIIDIGYKSEGAVSTSEFAELSENPVGEEVEVFLECLEDDHGGIVISKRRAEQQRAWDYVVNECEEGSIVEGTIRTAVKGGFIVDVGVGILARLSIGRGAGAKP